MASGKSRNIFYLAIAGILVIAGGYLASGKKNQPGGQSAGGLLEKAIEFSSGPDTTPTEKISDSGQKTFVFNSFHGIDFGNGGFQFEYPANWYNDGQYFSPIPIKYYDLVSVDAPIYFDLISTALFDTSGLKYQITHDKRKAPDSDIKIDDKTFNKYDLIDYGSSGGETTGRVIIYLGPQLSFNGDNYFLIFRWEEKPLTIYIPGNDIKIFDNMLLTLKFIH